MGRYKAYDRGPKRGVYDDRDIGDRASGVQVNHSHMNVQAQRRHGAISLVVGATNESVGTVKVYKTDKGFGFVGQDDGGNDVFVHASALLRAGLGGLASGQRVRMQIGQGQKGLEARSIELLE